MAEVTDIGSVLERLCARGIEQAVSDEELAAWEAEQAGNERRTRLESSTIGERMDAHGLSAVLADKLDDSRALQLVRSWMLSSRPALVLLGPPGVGKTVAAAWALARTTGRYVRSRDLADLHFGRGEAKKRYHGHRTCGLLVVDELGLERDHDEARATIDDIVDSRLRLPRRTLLMGNLEPSSFAARYDQRTLDRLGVGDDNDGVALLRALKGSSRRRRTA